MSLGYGGGPPSFYLQVLSPLGYTINTIRLKPGWSPDMMYRVQRGLNTWSAQVACLFRELYAVNLACMAQTVYSETFLVIKT